MAGLSPSSTEDSINIEEAVVILVQEALKKPEGWEAIFRAVISTNGVDPYVTGARTLNAVYGIRTDKDGVSHFIPESKDQDQTPEVNRLLRELTGRELRSSQTYNPGRALLERLVEVGQRRMDVITGKYNGYAQTP